MNVMVAGAKVVQLKQGFQKIHDKFPMNVSTGPEL